MSDTIRAATVDAAREFPIRDLWHRLALPEIPPHGNIKSPFRPDDNPTCSLDRNIFKDFGTGESLDTIALVRRKLDLDFPSAIRYILGESAFPDSGNGEKPTPRQIVATYDYYDDLGNPIYQVIRYHPKDFRQRRPDGKGGWLYSVPAAIQTLYKLPELCRAVALGGPIYIVEGEKDVDRLRALLFDATTPSGGASKPWNPEFTRHFAQAHVRIIPDNDKPGQKHAQEIAQALYGTAADIRILALPELADKGDVSDWLDQGHTPEELEALSCAAPLYRQGMSFLNLDELFAGLQENEPALLGNDLLFKGASMAVFGQGGLGKSRLILWLALCSIWGRDWLEFETHMSDLMWLFVQAENSRRRLCFDLAGMLKGVPPDSRNKINAQLRCLVPETDDDRDLTLRPEVIARLEREVKRLKPDIVVFDPLQYLYPGDDMMNPVQMRFCHHAMTTIAKAHNPDATTIINHHAKTGREAIAGAVGYDKASFGFGSKALFSAVRSAINVAPGDPDDPDLLILSCGKNNDGPQFNPFAVQFDSETRIYHPAKEFDLQEWYKTVTSKPTWKGGPKAKCQMSDVTDVLIAHGPGGLKYTAFTIAIMDHSKVSIATAKRMIDRAEKEGKIWNTQGYYTMRDK